jgi:hypothetical protein
VAATTGTTTSTSAGRSAMSGDKCQCYARRRAWARIREKGRRLLVSKSLVSRSPCGFFESIFEFGTSASSIPAPTGSIVCPL